MLAAADNMLLFHFVWVDPPLPLWGLRVLEKQFKTLLDGGEEKKRKKKEERQTEASDRSAGGF